MAVCCVEGLRRCFCTTVIAGSGQGRYPMHARSKEIKTTTKRSRFLRGAPLEALFPVIPVRARSGGARCNGSLSGATAATNCQPLRCLAGIAHEVPMCRRRAAQAHRPQLQAQASALQDTCVSKVLARAHDTRAQVLQLQVQVAIAQAQILAR